MCLVYMSLVYMFVLNLSAHSFSIVSVFRLHVCCWKSKRTCARAFVHKYSLCIPLCLLSMYPVYVYPRCIRTIEALYLTQEDVCQRFFRRQCGLPCQVEPRVRFFFNFFSQKKWSMMFCYYALSPCLECAKWIDFVFRVCRVEFGILFKLFAVPFFFLKKENFVQWFWVDHAFWCRGKIYANYYLRMFILICVQIVNVYMYVCVHVDSKVQRCS